MFGFLNSCSVLEFCSVLPLFKFRLLGFMVWDSAGFNFAMVFNI